MRENNITLKRPVLPELQEIEEDTHLKLPYWKRVFDVVFSITAIILFFPFFILLGILIKLNDRGPILFKQKRVGYKGKEFYIYKFRTMYPDAEERLKEILKNNPQAKKEWEETFKLKNDPRITPIGKFLRRTSLDEVPQFINVLKGEMSVVGPRPVKKEELEKYYGKYARYYTSVKPGITGLWQVEGRNDLSYKERVRKDVFYAKKHSFLLDMKIILKTIKVVLTGKGAY